MRTVFLLYKELFYLRTTTYAYVNIYFLDDTPLNAHEKLDNNKETDTVPNEVRSETAADQRGLAFTLIHTVKMRVLTCLASKQMQAFSDYL